MKKQVLPHDNSLPHKYVIKIKFQFTVPNLHFKEVVCEMPFDEQEIEYMSTKLNTDNKYILTSKESDDRITIRKFFKED